MSYKRYHELLQFFILILVLFGLPQSTTALLPEPPLAQPYHFQIHQSAASIGQKNWDSVQTNNLSPFTSFNYLHLLESTGCASPSTGWTPIHVTVSTQSTLSSPPLAIVPCYAKSHSFGEFIFDQPWAEAGTKPRLRERRQPEIASPRRTTTTRTTNPPTHSLRSRSPSPRSPRQQHKLLPENPRGHPLHTRYVPQSANPPKRHLPLRTIQHPQFRRRLPYHPRHQ